MKLVKSARGFVQIIIAVIFALAIGAGAMLAYQKFSQKTPSPSPTPTTSTPTTKESPAASDETTDWKTYTNTQNSYSLNYPTVWAVKVENSPIDTVTTKTQIESKDYVVGQPDMGGGFIPGAKSGARLEIYVSRNPNFKSYEEFKNFEETKSTEFGLNYFTSQEEITINNLKAVKKIGGKPYLGEQSYAYTFYKGTIYKIYLTSSVDQQSKFSQILSTFKFTQ